ncbi:MAG: hypothetical protein ACPKM0_00320 [Pleomorphochaeta sp.]
MTKKFKMVIISSILFMFVFLLFFSMFNSEYLIIDDIIVTVDKGDIPPSIKTYLKKYQSRNIFKINCKLLDTKMEDNAFIYSAKSKISIGKKLIINLKKNEVNAIIKTIDNENYAILSNKNMYLVDDEDKSLLDSNLLLIEMDNNVFNSLLVNENLNKFEYFINNIDILYDYNYLISSVKYDNNIKNSFGFFELKLNNNNTIIRVREEVDFSLIKSAIKISQELISSSEKYTVLDVYDEAIIKRKLSLGG